MVVLFPGSCLLMFITKSGQKVVLHSVSYLLKNWQDFLVLLDHDI